MSPRMKSAKVGMEKKECIKDIIRKKQTGVNDKFDSWRIIKTRQWKIKKLLLVYLACR